MRLPQILFASGKSRKLPHRFVIYDMVHKTAVTILVTASAGLFVKLIYDVQFYIRKQRPALLKEAKLKSEQEMAARQQQSEEQLLLQEQLQKTASETLK